MKNNDRKTLTVKVFTQLQKHLKGDVHFQQVQLNTKPFSTGKNEPINVTFFDTGHSLNVSVYRSIVRFE